MKKDICGTAYNVIDAVSDITVADSEVCRQNKINKGNGERKIYISNKRNNLDDFFEGSNKIYNGFIIKQDLLDYMKQAKSEYLEPSQEYRDKKNFPIRYRELIKIINEKDELISFQFYRSRIDPPRVYINAAGTRSQQLKSEWQLIGDVALPNLTKLSIMKLEYKREIKYYFKLESLLEDINDEEDELREEETKINENDDLSKTEKQAIVFARRGQGSYRKNLLKEINYCPFTLVDDEHLLIASHIKPWKASNNSEKKDPKNGFVFTPTYDILFDKGYISFTDDKHLLISPWLSKSNIRKLGLEEDMLIEHLPAVDKNRKRYLEYHRKMVLRK